MPKCKNCKKPYMEPKNFCDYCGNPLPLPDKTEEEKHEWIPCPTCKRQIIETTSICPFCGENINLDKIVEEAVIKSKNKSYAILGCILGLFAAFVLFFYPLASLSMGVVGLFMSIVGINGNKKVGIIGTILSSLVIMITSFLLILVIGFDYHNDFFSWSITEEEVEESLSGNTKYKKEIYNSWEQIDGENLLILSSEGTYEWYQNKMLLDNNFMKGIFILENGISMKSDMMHEDDNYFYYQLTLINLQSSVTGENIARTVKETVYNVMLNKNTRNTLCLENTETGVKTYFNKQSSEVIT